MYAKIAAIYVKAHAKCTFKDPSRMESYIPNSEFIDVFDHKGGGTHKYIPTEKLNTDLGLRQGAGVYAFWQMGDGSYLLMTCDGPVACWSGKRDEPAEWPPEPRSDLI